MHVEYMPTQPNGAGITVPRFCGMYAHMVAYVIDSVGG